MKRTHQKLSNLFLWILTISGYILLIISLICGVLLFYPFQSDKRVTFVFATNPIEVVTIDSKEGKATVVRIAEDLAIDGPYALGRYPISSFWKMGSFDSRDRDLLSLSIQYSFGIPIDGYIGQSFNSLIESSDSVDTLYDLFSIGSIASIFSKKTVTNIPLLQRLQVRRKIASMRRSDIKVVDIQQSMSTFKEELLDETSREVLDQARADILLKNIFVHTNMRKEALSIAVINTTKVPELARTIARQLTNSGGYVITVDSQEASIKNCEMIASEAHLKSETAHFIREKFDCKEIISTDLQREDIVMRLGEDIGSLYRSR